MRLLCLPTMLLLWGFAVLSPCRAQPLTSSAYTVVVPMSGTATTERNRAFSTALAQVLARVSGGRDLRSRPGYDEALSHAPEMVKYYRFRNDELTGLQLQVSFDPGSVRRAVTQMQSSRVGVKPPVLLIVRDAQGTLLGPDALASLALVVNQRGYGVAYPDTALPALDTSKLMAADPSALAAMASHYHTGLALLGRMHQDSADWTLLSGGHVKQWTDRGDDSVRLLAEAGRTMADNLGQQLNVIGEGGRKVRLWIAGLYSALDYASMLASLRSDVAVLKVTTLGAHDDGVLLMVMVSVPLPNLVAGLTSQGQLLPTLPHTGTDLALRWLH